MKDARRDALYDDMDGYLSERRRREPTKSEHKLADNIEVYHEKRGFWKKKEKKPTSPEAEGTKKRGLFASLMSIFIKEEEVMEELEEQVAVPEQKTRDAKEDLKHVAKLFLRTLEQLPEEELKRFRKTPEFMEFKDILRHHRVIK